MNSYRLLTLLALMGFTVARAQTEVAVGIQVTEESNIISGNEYILQSQASGTPYIVDADTYYFLPNAGNKATTACVYALIQAEDGTWRIRNHNTGKYWGVPSYNEAIVPSDENAAGTWSLNFSGGIAYPTAPGDEGTVWGLDRSSQKLWGYTTGTGITKRVKIFELSDTPLSEQPLAELENKVINVSETPASDLTIGQWYVMFDRGMTGSNPHGYLYEQLSSHTLYNTATVPDGLATSAARFLVRLADAEGGKYYVQTGYGNYFGPFTKSVAVPVTATPKEPITIEKIGGADGHFYLQATSTGIVLDANSLERGDATVVGWASAPPTAPGGNNDWAFYPVAVEDISSDIALFKEYVSVNRGYQTTGRGNHNALLLRIDISPIRDMNDVVLRFVLDDATAINISELYVYESEALEFIANIPETPIGSTTDISTTTEINIGDVTEGSHHLWLCATVKDDAELGAELSAALTGIDYTTGQRMQLDVTGIVKPDRFGMKVFERQHFVFCPMTDDCRYYRIPAMILDQEGNIIVAIDKRYNSNSDLGNHKIDVISMRSEDGGTTWTDKASVAIGDNYTAAYFGYGDAALARATNGDLVCIMASGSKTWGYGMVTAGFAKSSDNGRSWTLIKNLLGSSSFYDESSTDGSLSVNNIFTTSGKGLTTTDGVIMFTTNCRRGDTGNTNLCYILYSTDDGKTWRLSNALAYSGCDESKLEQRNDGSLLLSVRQSGNRGWNTATYVKNEDGTVTFNWGEQYRTSDIWGNACNADIIYYSRATDGQADILLHSYINTSGRESLQLSMSIDGGTTWKDVYNIQPNGSCYSTMQVLPDGTLAILYEDASYNVGNGYAINFVTITRDQILNWFTHLGGVIPDGIGLLPNPSFGSREGCISGEGRFYNLAGQQIVNCNMPKGVYIVNGQKIVIQ